MGVNLKDMNRIEVTIGDDILANVTVQTSVCWAETV